jgi:class 3 adenylate cyclase
MRRMEPRIQYARTADGVNLAYAVFGAGPAVIFPSGIWGSLHFYQAGVARFPFESFAGRGWSAVTYDGRGCGNSDRNLDDFGLETRYLDLQAIVDRVPDERIALVGEVQGGPASVLYAARHSERVAALVLSNTFVLGSSWYDIIPAFRISRSTIAMVDDEWEYYTLSMANAIRAHSDVEGARVLAQAFRDGMTPHDYVGYRKAVEDIDLTNDMRQITVPTLVAHDKLFLLERIGEIARQPAKLIPQARFIETSELGTAVDEFLREVWTQPTVKEREHPASHAGSGLRTVLFTDLVGHTEMMSRLGDEAGRAVLREHERITRDVLKQYGGTEIKTMGDGFMASFGSVTRAVECAVILQQAFANREGEPLAVRVGLNAGEPIEEDGDLFGATVILASRIAARAGPDEILVSDNVRSLSAGKGFSFSDRGEFVAKGFDEAVRVYAVNWHD